MKLYTVHTLKFGFEPQPDVRLVKEGFNWAAFIFSAFWALMKGYWWVAGGIFAASLAISLLLGVFGLDLFGQAVVNITFNMLLGIYANDLARWTLERRGYVEEDVISAQSVDHGLQRVVSKLQTD
ncbi:hypothetical protein MTBPR1_20112 [Candidatus Terasakiella magnetica]|uniref:DUF2628 domain-containing protein n=1 Tax=Candidatus Terasakiella magnetica TaxID=1867952 RepID=A0A1C3RGC9_9PROT|nr:DUF2628 domain-containing protein [Candidatus Terasakiella magnetica]SCA56264.1 hypothetical protein MTBPR1_20112 [Candidatus Terasakiella magnetica]